MIDPANITDFERSTRDLQEFLLFALVVAGKNSYVQSRKLHQFLYEELAWTGPADMLPFDRIRTAIEHGRLDQALRNVKMGKYALMAPGMRRMVERPLDLTTCTAEDIEAIPGCSFKTARFFITHSRRDSHYAVIDTHILKLLRDLGVDAPKTSPQTKSTYERLERSVQLLAELCGMTVADFDLMMWRRYSRTRPPGDEPPVSTSVAA